MGLGHQAGSEAWARELIEFQAWRREKVSDLLREVDEKVFTEQLHGERSTGTEGCR